MTNQKIILVATAIPDNSGQVRTDRFVSAIQKGLRDAEKSNDYDIIPVLATDLDNFSNELEKKKPNILVMVGHGDNLDRFVFEAKDGGREFAKPNEFANTLGLYSQTLECVLVIACHSQSLAEKITQHISYAVGYEEALLVDVAKEYVEKFFFYLANGNDYDLTNHKARTVMENKIHENQIPVLFQKDEIVNIMLSSKITKKKEYMTYTEFKELLTTTSMPDIFDVLDEYLNQMNMSEKTTYNIIKQEHQNGETAERKLKERLQVLSKKFLT